MSEIAGELPTSDDFAGVLNTDFRVSTNEGAEFEAKLVALERAPANGTLETFSLQFHAPADAPQAQGTYRMAHDHFPDLDIFLVPIRQDASGLYYEAVFNYVIAPKEQHAEAH